MRPVATQHRPPSRVPAWGLHLLAFAAAWTTLLSTLVPVYDPAAASTLPTHSHASLGAGVPPHTHATASTDGPGETACSAEGAAGATANAVACSPDSTVGLGALLISTGPVGVLAASRTVASRLEVPARMLGVPLRLLTPPPRG